MEYEWGTDCTDNLKMFNAEMDFRDAMQSLEKAEKELYWSLYWVDYAEAHKN